MIEESMRDNILFGKLLSLKGMNLSRFHFLLAKWYMGISIDLPTITSLDQAGIVTPFGCLLFRPFQSFTMGSAVVMVAGNETGFTVRFYLT